MTGLPPRHLKVYTKFQERGRRGYLILPEVRLCGLWLQSMGFERGQWVTVQPEPGRLVITVNKVESKTGMLKGLTYLCIVLPSSILVV